MSKKILRGSKMSTTEGLLVEQARVWLDFLCQEETNGPGEYGEAMRRIAQKLHLPFGFLHEMAYRPPKRISAGRFLTLAAAHDEYLQRRKYREERAAFKPNSALGRLMARAADFAAGEASGGIDGEE
jgi:hypothetical protein